MKRLAFTVIILITQLTYICQSYNRSKSNSQQQNIGIDQCPGNRFKHISKHTFDQQNDLQLTFWQMVGKTPVEKVVYKDQLFRTYTIFPLNMSFNYSDRKQAAIPISDTQIQITGGTLKINFTFDWQKKQLSSSIKGTGKGIVTTDTISFIKSLNVVNDSKKFQWNFVQAEKITISNSLALNEIQPYKAADYIVINQMLNELKTGEDTVKIKLVSALNINFTKILKVIVHENNDTYNEPLLLPYTYSDYHGQYNINYYNTVVWFSLKNGLDLLLSTLINTTDFDCGKKLPNEPEDESRYGGTQQFISTSFIKSTLRNAMKANFLNVQLSEQFWQSPAFQFFMGDVHEVMPETRNKSALMPITGICRSMDDKNFQLVAKDGDSYAVSVNFTCDFKMADQTPLVTIHLLVKYQIGVKMQNKYVDFFVRGISGVPIFVEKGYNITNQALAEFMIEQTLRMAVGGKVIGSGFKVLDRKYPNFLVWQDFLFLYDAATRLPPKNDEMMEEEIL